MRISDLDAQSGDSSSTPVLPLVQAWIGSHKVRSGVKEKLLPYFVLSTDSILKTAKPSFAAAVIGPAGGILAHFERSQTRRSGKAASNEPVFRLNSSFRTVWTQSGPSRQAGLVALRDPKRAT